MFSLGHGDTLFEFGNLREVYSWHRTGSMGCGEIGAIQSRWSSSVRRSRPVRRLGLERAVSFPGVSITGEHLPCQRNGCRVESEPGGCAAMKLFCPVSIALSCAAIAWPQAAVEHAAVTAASSAGATATGAAGKSIGGVFESLSKTLDKVGKSGTSSESDQPTATVSTAAKQVAREPTAPTSAKVFDPKQVTIGLDVEELIKRCGEPSMSISQVRNSRSVETYWYYGPHNDVLEVTLRDGRVTSATSKVTQAHEKDAVVFK